MAAAEFVVDVKIRSVEEVRQEVSTEYGVKIYEALHDISWRATRYAMDREWIQHDVMVEAHQAAFEILCPGETLRPCNCREHYGKAGA